MGTAMSMTTKIIMALIIIDPRRLLFMDLSLVNNAVALRVRAKINIHF